MIKSIFWLTQRILKMNNSSKKIVYWYQAYWILNCFSHWVNFNKYLQKFYAFVESKY